MENNPQSLIKAADTISGSFARLKFVSVACLVCAFLTAVVCVFYSVNAFRSMGDKVYLVDRNGEAFTASRVSSNVTRQDEIRKQAEYLHSLFFNVSSNGEAVQRNLESAMQLFADRSLYEYWNDIQESGFYRRISQSRSVQECIVDSVRVDTRNYPYTAVAYSTLWSTRQRVIVRSQLVTRFRLIDVPRNAQNLNGLMFENFEVLENKELGRKERGAN